MKDEDIKTVIVELFKRGWMPTQYELAQEKDEFGNLTQIMFTSPPDTKHRWCEIRDDNIIICPPIPDTRPPDIEAVPWEDALILIATEYPYDP